jgi:hypothetical protein
MSLYIYFSLFLSDANALYHFFFVLFPPLTRVSSLFLLLDSQRPHIVSPFIFCLAVQAVPIDKGEYSNFYIPPSRSSISLQTFFLIYFIPPLYPCVDEPFFVCYIGWMSYRGPTLFVVRLS